MQCEYCGATLPDVDFSMVYKELREENGRLEFQRNEVVEENEKLKGDISELLLELSSRGKKVRIVAIIAFAAGIIISSCISSL